MVRTGRIILAGLVSLMTAAPVFAGELEDALGECAAIAGSFKRLLVQVTPFGARKVVAEFPIAGPARYSPIRCSANCRSWARVRCSNR